MINLIGTVTDTHRGSIESKYLPAHLLEFQFLLLASGNEEGVARVDFPLHAGKRSNDNMKIL